MTNLKEEAKQEESEKVRLIQTLEGFGLTSFAGAKLSKLSVGELKTLVKDQEEEESDVGDGAIKKDLMAGIPSLNRPFVEELCSLFGIPTEGSKDKLLLKLRLHVHETMKRELRFGRYKGQLPASVLLDKGYMAWITSEIQKSTTSHQDLRTVYALGLLNSNFFQKKQMEERSEKSRLKEVMKSSSSEVKKEEPEAEFPNSPREEIQKEIPRTSRVKLETVSEPRNLLPKDPATRSRIELAYSMRDSDKRRQ
jgi:hypothetical protein